MHLPPLHAVLLGLVVGCSSQSTIKPAEVLDEHSGMTVGALQEPLEFVQRAPTAAQNSPTAAQYSPTAAVTGANRVSFAYLGPIEWDRMGEITYGLWLHVAPGNDKAAIDISVPSAVRLELDGGGVIELSPIKGPEVGYGPYKPVAAWGQTAYFALELETLKQMANSHKLELDIRSGDTVVSFASTHDTRSTLSQFVRARGITVD